MASIKFLQDIDVDGDIILGNANYFRSYTTTNANVRMLGINAGNVAYVGPIDGGPTGTILNASSTSAYLASYTSGVERMRITSTGAVGIGTSSPSARLEVIDTTAELLAKFGDNNDVYYLQVAGVRSMFGYNQTDAVMQGGITKGISFYTGSSTFSNSSNQRMRITPDGLVGIGTSSPSAGVHIVNSGSYGLIVENGSGTELLKIFNSGTSRFNGTVDIDGTSSGALNVGISSGSYPIRFSGSASSSDVFLGVSSSNSFLLYVNGADRLTVDASGSLTVSNDLYVDGGAIYMGANASPIMDNSADSEILLIGDTTSSDDVTAIEFYTWGSLQLRVDDGESIFYSSITARSGITTAANSDITLDATSELILGDDTKIVLDTNIATNSQMNGTIIKSVSSSTVQGVIYGLTTGTPAWVAADADLDVTTKLLAIATSTNANAGMLVNGVYRDSSHGFTVGSPLYVSNTAGVLTNTAPSGTGDYVRVVGYAIDANHIYFNPDNTWVQIS